MKSLPLLGLLATLAAPLYSAPVTGLDSFGGLQSVIAADASGFAYARLENGVQFRVNGIVKNVLFYGPQTVRVNANSGLDHWTNPSLVVVRGPSSIPFTLSETDNALLLSSGKLRVEVDKSSGALSFYDVTGRLFTKESADKPQTVRDVSISGSPSYEVTNTFTLQPDEGIYGFGFIGPDGINRRGQELHLVQTNIGIVIPVMVSSRRYGVMWDIASKMTFKDGADGATLWAESAPGGVDYYFFGGETMDEVIAGYRHLTGDAPMFPKQAFGLFMSKERYKTQAEVIDVAEHFRKAGFPLDYMVQDWQYWGSDTDGTWSGMMWNEERYPDPEGLTRKLHDMHLKLMVSIWPSVGNDTELGRELDSQGLRFEPLHWISKKARVYDAFSEEGRRIYNKYVKSGLFDKGVDALWMDGTEVEVGTACWNPNEVEHDIKALGNNALGDFTRYLNCYTLMTTLGAYEWQRAASNKRVFTLTRSAWAGAQRTAAASWSGDIFASWDTLRSQIGAGLDVTITGNPYWTQDTGGFFVPGASFPGGEENPAYRELYVRWYQFSAFNPILRIHGTSIAREPYLFQKLDPATYEAMLAATNLRYRLLPYIYSLAWRVTSEGYTMMRPLPMDFPDDTGVRNISDAFLFGPSFLVHPVTRAMYHASEPPPGTIPAEVLRTTDGQRGLNVQYFSGVDFDKPAGSSVDTKIDYDWPGPPLANPPPGLTGFDRFSARWTGTITAPESGEYEIGGEYDDGIRIYIDGKLLVEDWSYGAKRYKGAKVTLKKGQRVALKAEFHQGGNERAFRLAWRTPSEARALAQSKPVFDNTMETYLPAGSDWYDFWTNEHFHGGSVAKRICPLDVFPLYVRAGSIVPMGPFVQYATDKPDAPYEIRIYPGADAVFTIYEDDNETYAYEKGEHATYSLAWNDAAKTLTVGPREGSFPGMVTKRTLRVVLAGPGYNSGTSPAEHEVKTVEYTGQPVEIKF
jgi:alpha-D-xyloside xylohydrolase